MAVGRTGCDGCGRTVPSDESATVVMPNGERVTCCPHCEPHARAAAGSTTDEADTGTITENQSLDRRRDTCDGCRSPFRKTELEPLVLGDGTVIACCPSCVADAPTGNGNDGSTISATDSSNGAVRSSHDSATDEKKPRCSQCNEAVTAELFRVTTIDDRTERLCRACKNDAEADGIVTNVDMRTSRAREVLGVDEDATAEEIRAAYHRQVKRAHPDRKSGSRSAFQLVTEAYERLQWTVDES